MAAPAVTETEEAVVAPAATKNYITRFMAAQRLSSNEFCNGFRVAARTALNSAKGIRPSSWDRHMRHPDREVFEVSALAAQLFPSSDDCRQQFIQTNWEAYEKPVDRKAITDVIPKP